MPPAFRFLLLPCLCLAGPLAAAAQTAPGAGEARRLDAITVSSRLPGDPARRPEAVARLDGEAVARTGASHAAELLARLPGAWASRGSGQEQLLALRSPVLTGPGACGSFLVLDDGVPIRPAGLCNVNQLSEVNLRQAGRVELLRGPGSAVHGSNALHGVVAVAPPAFGSGTAFGLEAGRHGLRRGLLSLEDAAGRLRLDGHATRAGSFRADEGYRLGQASLQWRPRGEAGSTRLALALHRLDQDTAGFVRGEGAWRDERRFANENPEAFREAEAARLLLHHERPLGTGWLLVRPYARSESQTFLQHFNLGQPLEENGSRSLGLQSLFEHEALRLGLDMEWAEGWLRQTQARPLTSGTPAQNAQRPAGRHYDYRVDIAQLALFGEWLRPLGPGTLLLGARGETLRYRYDTRLPAGNLREDGSACGFGGCLYLRPEDRRDRFQAASLQLGWRQPLDPHWAFSARAARAFRFPQATELYRLQRGQAVAAFAPETAHSLEAGLRFERGRITLALDAYAMRKRDVILRDAAGLSVPGAATEHLGIELELRLPLPGEFVLEANLAWSDQRYAFDGLLPGGEQVRRGARIDTAPEWLGGLRLGRRVHERLDLELEGQWQGGYPLDAANTRRYGGHVLWHLRSRLALDEGWSLSLRLLNLTDRHYAERLDFAFGEERAFPGAGRSLFLGIERRD
ncbi:MAG: TonB-dependent receptor [Silanimonas lenta]